MHPPALRAEALALVEHGVNDCEIARRLGVPRTTVRDWRRPTYMPRPKPGEICPRCWRRARPARFCSADYAELLGIYLGDGHITESVKTQRLRIFLDARYSTIVDETEALLRRCFPSNRVGRLLRHGGSMVVLFVYSCHLECLFPQHGAGKKHERPIVLEPWQTEQLRSAPWAFIRGCIRSDGCAFINRTGPYDYLTYGFDNLSHDIRGLFIDACGFVGVDCRAAGKSVRINRRASVALMLEHVGVKS